jgi:invasin-like protein
VTRLHTVLLALVFAVLLAVDSTAAGAATLSATGSVSATGTKWQFRPFTVTDNGTVSASLAWSTPSASLLIGLAQKTSAGTWAWVSGSRGAQPVTASWSVTPGTWRLAVEALSGSSSYTLTASYPATLPPALTVTLAPATIAADGSSTTVATAHVTGTDGGPVIGADVEFASTDPSQTIGPVTDNGDGSYSATITASTSSGPSTITGTDMSASPALSGHATLTETSDVPPQVTLTFSRTELSAADHFAKGTCTRDDDDIAPLDTVVAPYIAQNFPNVHPVGSIETGPTQDTGHWCPHSGASYGTSWADLTALQNLGWSFIDHSATYPQSWTSLTAQQQYDQTCGSRDVITAHGLNGASGQFEWPNNVFSSAVNDQYVRRCFSFSRGYGTGVTTAAQVAANAGQNSTEGVSGGHCNVTGLTCSTVNNVKAYTLPSKIITQMQNLQPGQWLNLQTYVLVTGTSPTYATNKTQWDCTNADPRYHWTNDVERYCWSDMQTVLAALNADTNVVSNSASGVAAAWGLAPPSQ